LSIDSLEGMKIYHHNIHFIPLISSSVERLGLLTTISDVSFTNLTLAIGMNYLFVGDVIAGEIRVYSYVLSGNPLVF